MAPEVICKNSQGPCADFYAVGVMIFEFMKGRVLFSGENRHEIRDKILVKQHQLTLEDLPKGWSVDSANIVNRVISM